MIPFMIIFLTRISISLITRNEKGRHNYRKEIFIDHIKRPELDAEKFGFTWKKSDCVFSLLRS